PPGPSAAADLAHGHALWRGALWADVLCHRAAYRGPGLEDTGGFSGQPEGRDAARISCRCADRLGCAILSLGASSGPPPPLARSALKGEVAVATRRRLCGGKGVKQSCESRRGISDLQKGLAP